jgi:hypothetical protein
MTIEKGSILNPNFWDVDLAGKVLRVMKVEHGIWEAGDHITHKIMVYTEAIEDTPEARDD